MPLEEHRGYVEIGGEKFGATLKPIGDRIHLEVVDGTGDFMSKLPEKVETAQFRGPKGYFTLTHLFRTGSHSRLGVGGQVTYRVQVAIEEGLFDSAAEIKSKTWLLYVEDFAQIVHITGLDHTLTFPEGGPIIFNWRFVAATPARVKCAKSGIELRFGQDMKTGGDVINGPSLSFRYPIVVTFESETGYEAAIETLARIRSFFSMVMGRALAMDEVSMRLEIDDAPHDMKVHGLLPTQRSEKPEQRIADFQSIDEMVQSLDDWLSKFDSLKEAIQLHLQGLENRNYPHSIRFQTFIQAIEALHRKTAPNAAQAIDREPIIDALKKMGISGDVTDRVNGVLAHAHEPGLRQRLKHYWDAFSAEIAVLRPSETKKNFVARAAATRNYYAHRTDRDSSVLEGADLWDGTELAKAISHMAILHEIGVSTAGIGSRMVLRRFAEFTIRN